VRSEDTKRVLLVEQHHALRAALCDLVRSWGHVVRDAANGRKALAIALWWQPEVVCLDLDLPLMSAYDVAKRIAAFGESRPLLIGVSGVGRANERQRAAGCRIRRVRREAGWRHCAICSVAAMHYEKPRDRPRRVRAPIARSDAAVAENHTPTLMAAQAKVASPSTTTAGATPANRHATRANAARPTLPSAAPRASSAAWERPSCCSTNVRLAGRMAGNARKRPPITGP
jgi:CheY-like chemotaxis protein